MDINSLGSSYLDTYKTQADSAASKLEGQLDGDFAVKSDDELMDACKQFEAYFVEQMFKEMMKTVPASEGTSSYASDLMDYHKGNMLQELATDSTETNSLGMAQMLYEQMKRNYGI